MRLVSLLVMCVLCAPVLASNRASPISATDAPGIPDHYTLLHAAPAGLTNERVVEVLVEHGKLDIAPGTEWSYSNGVYVLLSMVVAHAAEQDFHDFMQERIFTPLGMTRTQVVDTIPPEVTTGAGGMYTTVRDLSRWGDALAGFATMLFRDRKSGDTLIVLCNQGSATPGMFTFVEAIGAPIGGGQPALQDIPVSVELNPANTNAARMIEELKTRR